MSDAWEDRLAQGSTTTPSLPGTQLHLCWPSCQRSVLRTMLAKSTVGENIQCFNTLTQAPLLPTSVIYSGWLRGLPGYLATSHMLTLPPVPGNWSQRRTKLPPPDLLHPSAPHFSFCPALRMNGPRCRVGMELFGTMLGSNLLSCMMPAKVWWRNCLFWCVADATNVVLKICLVSVY